MEKDAAYSSDSCNTIIVTSCKGGVGKSTVVANLAMALAKMNKKTLAIDCDFSNRSLDLILGCEDSVIYDINDVVLGRTSIKNAVIRDKRNENLFMCAAPLFECDTFSSDDLLKVLNDAKEKFELDFILIDTPGAAGETLKLVSKVADSALIIVSHQPTSARAAERTGLLLDELELKNQRLIINAFDADAVLSDKRAGISELINKTHTQIIGIIPNEYELSLMQEYGMLSFESKNKRIRRVASAFSNVAVRLSGGDIPLLKKVYPRRRRKRLIIK